VVGQLETVVFAAVLVSGILFALTVFGTMLVGVAAIVSIALALILLGLRANRDRR
jgi:hypothetical protein